MHVHVTETGKNSQIVKINIHSVEKRQILKAMRLRQKLLCLFDKRVFKVGHISPFYPIKQGRFTGTPQKKAPSFDKDRGISYGLALVKLVDGLLIFFMIAQQRNFVTNMTQVFHLSHYFFFHENGFSNLISIVPIRI